MNTILNLDKKRVCDLSHDKKVIAIKKKDCVTIVRVKNDGTLQVTHLREGVI